MLGACLPNILCVLFQTLPIPRLQIYLDVHEIQLYRIVSIDINIGEEEFLPKQQHLVIRDSLFSETLVVV